MCLQIIVEAMKPRSLFRFAAPKQLKEKKYVLSSLPESSPSSLNIAASAEFIATPFTAGTMQIIAVF